MTCAKKKTTPIKLEAVRMIWGVEQCRSFKAVSAGGAGGKYFKVNLIGENYEEVKGYFYMDDGDDVDPAPAGLTLLGVVTIGALDTDEVNAQSIVDDINANATYGKVLKAYISEDSADTFVIENMITGKVSTEDAGDSGFTYALGITGVGGDLGKTAQGGTSLNLETSTFELKSDQTAELLLGEINQGNLTSIEASLIELNAERFEALIGSVVGDILDMGVDGNYVGIGTSRLYQEMSALGGRMILHPIRIADVTDRSEDWSFHLTAPMPNSLNFSGTEQQAMEMNFKPYVDESKPAEASVGGYGDWLALINL